MGGSTKYFSIGDKRSMRLSEARSRRMGGAIPDRCMKARRHGPHHRSNGKNYCTWQAGKIKMFWFADQSRIWVVRWLYRKGNAGDLHICRASYIHSKTLLMLSLAPHYSLDQPPSQRRLESLDLFSVRADPPSETRPSATRRDPDVFKPDSFRKPGRNPSEAGALSCISRDLIVSRNMSPRVRHEIDFGANRGTKFLLHPNLEPPSPLPSFTLPYLYYYHARFPGRI